MDDSTEANMNRARQAQAKLAKQLLGVPQVSLIDIGYPLEAGSEKQELVLRVHLRPPATRENLPIPAEVDGIPVQVIYADYRPE